MADVYTEAVHDPHAYAKKMVLTGLPAHAQTRYRQYGDRLAEAQHMLRHLRDRDEEMAHRLTFATHNAQVARANNTLSPTEEKLLAAQEVEHDQLVRRRAKVNEQRIALEHICNALDSWSVNRGGPSYDPNVEPPVAQLRDGEDPNAALSRVRGELSTLNAQLAHVRSAPPPPDEIRQLIKDKLDLLSRSMPLGFRWERNKLTGTTDELVLTAPDMLGWTNSGHGAVTAFLYALFPEQVLARFTVGIDDAATGIPRADKPALIAELKTRIVDLELEELSLVEQLDALPRASMSPLALLGLVPVRTAMQEAA